jgi:hypothetical protein
MKRPPAVSGEAIRYLTNVRYVKPSSPHLHDSPFSPARVSAMSGTASGRIRSRPTILSPKMAKQWKCTCKPKFPETICVVCVGELLHYSPRTVYNKAEAGTIPSIPMSKRHRIFLRASIAYMIQNLQTGIST